MKTKIINIIVTIAAIVAATLCVVLLGLYCWEFRNGSLSTNSQDWGGFGDYIGGIFSFANLVLMVYIVFLAQNLTQNFNDKDSIKKHIDECLKSVADVLFCVTALDNTSFLDHQEICKDIRLLLRELHKNHFTLENKIEELGGTSKSVGIVKTEIRKLISINHKLMAAKTTPKETAATAIETGEIEELKNEILPVIGGIKIKYVEIRKELK